MENIKQNILDASRKLFNEAGFSQVTIRMIANKLEISSGNLNYHFRKREDILEALYFEMVAIFDERVQRLGDQPISLKLMKADIQTSMKRMVDYRFFWSDLYYLLKSNDKIKHHFIKVKADRINGYKMVFDFLMDLKTLKKPSFAQEYPFLIDRMIDYSNTWLYASELYEVKKNSVETVEVASFQLLSMLYPYLTASGHQDFQNLFPGFMLR
ncbi:hypothetical protein BKI52_30305 [marine bacterium AO1-C]|nr:hypothetical protein BKI52_30305 [marine bacterium AO1-C]